MAELVLEKYEIIREIARSNDIVYEARDSRLGRAVALKELNFPAGIAGQAKRERIERFNREARAAGRLTHPNIVSIFDAGEDSGRYFIAMEYLDGQSLRESLAVNPQPGIIRACNIVISVLEGLHHAHINRVIHRDIKPDNIFLLKNDVVKITDFGIARITEDSALTSDGQVFGTPSYMSPEQIHGQTIDHRTDIFSTGVMLYEMVAGRKPFTGDSVIAITYAVANSDPPPISGISVQLDSVIRRALQKSASNRYDDCSHMITQLRDALDNAGSPVRTIHPGSSLTARPSGGGNLVVGLSGSGVQQVTVHPRSGLPMMFDPATSQWYTIDQRTGIPYILEPNSGVALGIFGGAAPALAYNGPMPSIYPVGGDPLPFDWNTGQQNPALTAAAAPANRQPRGPLLTEGQKLFLKLVVAGVTLGLIIALGTMAAFKSYGKYQEQQKRAAVMKLANAGNTAYQQGNYPAAISAFLGALKLKPAPDQSIAMVQNLAYCYVNLAQLEAKSNHLRTAEQDYSLAIHYSPNYQVAHTGLAQVQETLNDYTGAQHEYAIAEQLSPSAAPPTSLPALPAAPTQPTMQDYLANNAQKALDYYNLGQQYESAGHDNMARNQFNLAITTSPNSLGGQYAQKALDQLNSAGGSSSSSGLGTGN